VPVPAGDGTTPKVRLWRPLGELPDRRTAYAALENAEVVRDNAGEAAPNSMEAEFPPSRVGTFEPIPADANPNVESVAEALRTGKHPERLTALLPANPFDREAFEKDPAAYLAVVEPGRVWQAAQPGKGVRVLRPLGGRFHMAEQGKLVELKVLAPAGAPVTFTSFDAGAFENRLTSITVRAGKDGIARAPFKGTPGTINDIRILAASPLATGQVEFKVVVTLPAEAATDGTKSDTAKADGAKRPNE